MIDSFVAGENPPQEKIRGIRFKKAGIYLLLTIVGQIIHSGGSQQQWWQPLEGAWSLLTTGFVVAAIGFFVAGFVPARARETMGLENWRIARDLRLVSNWFLYPGVVLIFLSVFVFGLLPRQDFAWFLFLASTFEIVAGLGCIATFLGLRKLKNWARIVAMVLAPLYHSTGVFMVCPMGAGFYGCPSCLSEEGGSTRQLRRSRGRLPAEVSLSVRRAQVTLRPEDIPGPEPPQSLMGWLLPQSPGSASRGSADRCWKRGRTGRRGTFSTVSVRGEKRSDFAFWEARLAATSRDAFVLLRRTLPDLHMVVLCAILEAA